MRRALLTLLVLSVATGAGAHHSPALYDLQKTITLAGRVVKYEWSNPHVYILIRVGGRRWRRRLGSRDGIPVDDGACRLVQRLASSERSSRRSSEPREEPGAEDGIA